MRLGRRRQRSVPAAAVIGLVIERRSSVRLVGVTPAVTVSRCAMRSRKICVVGGVLFQRAVTDNMLGG